MKIQFISKDEFIDYAAYDCIEQSPEEDRSNIRNNPDPTFHHFGLGTFIRNEYIYDNEQIQFEYESEDDLSREIIEAMISILTQE